MIKYYKLFDILNRLDMKKTDLLDILSSKTIAKLSKGDIITTDTIDKICEKLNCQPGDIMEYVIKAKNINNNECEIAIHENSQKLKENLDIFDDAINEYPLNFKPTIPD